MRGHRADRASLTLDRTLSLPSTARTSHPDSPHSTNTTQLIPCASTSFPP
ncbi:unnamed protein product [Onchocerca flexuosa]|uniref:Uncharacterized protein n=1 Tax=Onchocerca flexuosa TaxID=387005 RepID=A0A183H6G7_9BILA|nr:unnamed protein product [Onchocerca flexuosa]